MYFKYSLLIVLYHNHFYWYIGFLEKKSQWYRTFFLSGGTDPIGGSSLIFPEAM